MTTGRCSTPAAASAAATKWDAPHWRGKELAHLRKLAEQAGWYAYAGKGWSAQAIRQEALTFWRVCPLLRAYQDDPLIEGLVISRFFQGWRAHEAAEARA